MIPKRDKLYVEALRLLTEHKQLTTQELTDNLVKVTNLSYQEQTQLGSGFTPLFNNRVASAVRELEKAGLIYSPARGIYSITADGHDVLQENPVSISESELRYLIRSHKKLDDEIREPPSERSWHPNIENYSIGSYETTGSTPSRFEEFSSVLKGRSIISARERGHDRFELGLSGDLMLRFFWTEHGLHKNLVNTTNKDDTPAIVMDLGDMDRKVPISIIAAKLNALRTIYAVFYLINDGRQNELQKFLLENPKGDIEAALLEPDDQLFIESISYGSWVIVAWAKKAGKALKSMGAVVGMTSIRGRESFLSKMEAEARLKGAEADKTANEARRIEAETREKEVDIRAKEFDLQKKQMDYLLEVTEKLNNKDARDILEDRLIQATRNFNMGDRSDGNSYRQLGDGSGQS